MATKEQLEDLKKVSDRIYEEANPPADRDRPLQWRRDFNFIVLPLKKVEMVSTFNVHDKELFDLEHKYDNVPWQRLKPDVRAARFITGIVDAEQFRDKIYCAVEDKDKGVTKLEHPSGDIHVTLRIGIPFEGNERYPAGLYAGTCFRSDHDGPDSLWLDIYCPEKHLTDIFEQLARNPNLQISVGVYLLSFSFEVADFLADWRYPKRLFIEDHTDAFADFVKTSSVIPPLQSSSIQNTDGTQPRNPAVDVSPITTVLGRLTLGIWVLVALIAYLLLR